SQKLRFKKKQNKRKTYREYLNDDKLEIRPFSKYDSDEWMFENERRTKKLVFEYNNSPPVNKTAEDVVILYLKLKRLATPDNSVDSKFWRKFIFINEDESFKEETAKEFQEFLGNVDDSDGEYYYSIITPFFDLIKKVAIDSDSFKVSYESLKKIIERRGII
ncbi:MAG: hypothetical protein L3J69_16695, partial [Desulfobacula sp.]|nr:hypothetical protein [Desulfobacula sp.]